MHTDHQAATPPQHGRISPLPVGGLAPDLTSLADVVDRLFTEFASHLSLSVVVSTVRRCRRELDIIHGPALPELVERLARQRLHATVSTRENQQLYRLCCPENGCKACTSKSRLRARCPASLPAPRVRRAP